MNKGVDPVWKWKKYGIGVLDCPVLDKKRKVIRVFEFFKNVTILRGNLKSVELRNSIMAISLIH